MPKITKRFISTVQHPIRGQIIYRDSTLIGFGLRVTPKSMSFIAEGRVKGILRRVTLGKQRNLSPADARNMARKLLAKMAEGKDPVIVERRVKGIRLEEVLENFIAIRILRPNTIRTYRQMLRRCLGDWLGLSILDITREMVEQRHIKLRRPTHQGTLGEAQANTVMRILGTLMNFAATNYEFDGKPILIINPVNRLSVNRRWYSQPRRQNIIPDHKLGRWHTEVLELKHQKVKDYLMLLLLTGLRRNEGASLKWEDIDFQAKVLKVRAENTKNGHEHRLPMSDFISQLLTRRYECRVDSEFVFPGQKGNRHLIDSDYVIRGVALRSDCPFNLHDLRRTFLTVAERLSLPYVVLKKLANHSGKNDTTFGYIVVDVERLRPAMQLITDEILRLCVRKNKE